MERVGIFKTKNGEKFTVGEPVIKITDISSISKTGYFEVDLSQYGIAEDEPFTLELVNGEFIMSFKVTMVQTSIGQSLSDATGLSIDTKGRIALLYGFEGNNSPDDPSVQCLAIVNGKCYFTIDF